MEMNRNTVIVTILSIVGIFALLFAVYAFTNKDPQTAVSKDIPETRTVQPGDHVSWSKDKKVILTEYADLQCPACKNFHDVLKQMEASEEDKDIINGVTYVYRHYPLQQIHKNALGAAHIVEAAAVQGKFFEALDALYDSQETWQGINNPKFETYLSNLKLDINKLKADAGSKSVKDAVTQQIASGNRVGVQATPTFFLNGKKITVNSIEDFKKQLREAAKVTK